MISSGGRILFLKAKSRLSPNELFGIDALVRAGCTVVVRKENPLAPANIDLLVDGDLCELKNITNANSLISNQIKRARIKWLKLGLEEPVRIAFTMNDSINTLEEMIDGLRKRKRPNESIVLVSPDGGIVEI